MNKKYVIVLGISLLVSALTGYLFQEKKYYILSYEGKREVTKQKYEERNSSSINYVIEKRIDSSLILLSFFTILGTGLIISAFWLEANGANSIVPHRYKAPIESIFTRMISSLGWHIPIDYKKSEEYFKHALINKDNKGQIEDYSKAIKINPKFNLAYNNRACSKLMQSDFKGAISDYTKVIKLDPQNAKSYINRSSAKYRSKDYEGAIADLNKAKEINPLCADAYHSLGEAKYKLHNYYGAIGDYSRAIEINPKYSHSYNARGKVHFDNNNILAAISDFDRAIELNPRNAWAYINRGNAKVKLGQTESAKIDFNKATELGYTFVNETVK